MIITGDAHFGGAIADAAGIVYNPQADSCIARVRGPELLGGVVYTNFTGHSVSAHVAIFYDGWVDREMLWMVFDYPFEQLKVKKIFAYVPETNSKSLAFAAKLGFKMVTRIPELFADGGMVVMAMAREDCRFLKMPRSLKEAA